MILSKFFIELPNETYINGIKQDNINKIYNFNESENNIKLIWNYDLTSISQMFRGCSNITEIDFSDFDTSRFTSLKNMFYECWKLTSLTLSNFVTSRVTNMEGMFKC